MATHALSAATLICIGRQSRARLMQEYSAGVSTGHATEFLKGMHVDAAAASEQVMVKNQMLSLAGQRLTLVCTEGRLWLTRDGDIEDYILDAGRQFEIRPGDRAAVQALRPSRVRLQPA